jgi:hypothetical protein
VKQYVGGELVLRRMQMVSEVVVQKWRAQLLWFLTGSSTKRIVVFTEVPDTGWLPVVTYLALNIIG